MQRRKRGGCHRDLFSCVVSPGSPLVLSILQKEEIDAMKPAGTDEGLERDSRKDQAVVIIFIIATGGLLTWAVVRPWVQGWVEVSAPVMFQTGPERIVA